MKKILKLFKNIQQFLKSKEEIFFKTNTLEIENYKLKEELEELKSIIKEEMYKNLLDFKKYPDKIKKLKADLKFVKEQRDNLRKDNLKLIANKHTKNKEVNHEFKIKKNN